METVIKVEDVSKEYRLGVIGTGMLSNDLQSWWARARGKEDPNTKVGEEVKTGGRFLALDKLNLTVNKGEALGILGANGAGKSTLLKILSRITAPTDGTIYLKGRVTSMLEVGTGFHPEMTGRENIYMNGAILGMPRHEIDKRMDEIIEFSEIGEFIDTPVKRYSSGMYVKLAFSVAANLNSDIMIIDEVLAVGDMNFQSKCIEKMRSIVVDEDRTVLCVSHNIYNIKQLCERCIVLDKGKLVFDGHVDEAIAIYLGNTEGLSTQLVHEIDKNNVKARSEGKRPVPQLVDMTFEKCELSSRDDKNLEFLLRWMPVPTDTVNRLRLIICYMDSTVAGSSLSQEFSGKPAEETITKFSLDVSLLAPGRYYFEFDFLEAGGSVGKLPRVLLVVMEKVFFTVVNPLEQLGGQEEENAGEENSLRIGWNHNSWGHIELPEARVIE